MSFGWTDPVRGVWNIFTGFISHLSGKPPALAPPDDFGFSVLPFQVSDFITLLLSPPTFVLHG